MSQQLKHKKELLSPPGDDILEHIDYIKMSQAELADRLGKTPSKVNDLISGKEPISYTTALQLEKVLGIKAQYWLNREMIYREKLARIEQEEVLSYDKDWVKQHPFKLLKKYGYIKSGKPGPDMVAEMLEFYGVASPDACRRRYVDDYASASFRKSKAHTVTFSSMATWLRIGELEMQKLQLPAYNSTLFKKILLEIKSLVRHHPDDFAKQLQQLCAKAGVAVIYTLCLPEAPVSGATRWFRNNPLIQLTNRHKTNDHFWFSSYHEAGHVLLHGKKEVFLEDFEGFTLIKNKEYQANQFAMKWLLPEKATEDLPVNLKDEDIIALADQYETHPGIVVGRLQWLDELKHNQGNHHKRKVQLFI
ncbi:MAG: helix-turn-helix domain-containing protein [Saprospiraceae bacterium]